MKTRIILQLLILCGFYNLFANNGLVQYVSPSGNDKWSGTIATANRQKSDGPLATIIEARNRIRKLKEQPNVVSKPITVYLRGGIYRLNEPFEFNSQDSGSPNAPVVYCAYPGEKPIISGGMRIKGWKKDNNGLFVTEIPEVASGKLYFNQLFVNGERRTRARSPNTNWFRIAGLVMTTDKSGKTVPRNRDAFIFKPGDIKNWKNIQDANIILFHSWENSIHPIKSVNLESNLVEFAAPLKEWWTICYWEKNQRYIVDNIFEGLDEPGEWYLERTTGKLYYYPMKGEKPETIEAEAPVVSELILLKGEPKEEKYVSNIIFRGISFQHIDWVRNPKGNSSTQAAVESPCAIIADGAANCVFEKCEIAHTGGYAIWIRRGCRGCKIQQTRIFDMGAGGVRVGECDIAKDDRDESSGNVVYNNHIYDGGHIFPGCVAIWVAQSSSNLISNNEIHNMFYTGISVGWNWNDATNRTHHNTIQYNHIHHIVNGVMSDAGGIYTLGVSPGSIIRNNVIHDVWPYDNPDFGWGIYLDGTCAMYLVESNVVYYTRSGGLMYNNGGHEHIIRNNIFALNATHSIWQYFEKRPNVFSNNIVLMTQGELFKPYGEASLKERIKNNESLGVWDYNIYWHTAGPDHIKFFRYTFEEWQKLGFDKHSYIAEPMFEDPFNGNFKFKKGSSYPLIGFKPIDVSNVGLVGDKEWRQEPLKFKYKKTVLPPLPVKIPKNISEDFEGTSSGAVPDGMTVNGIENGAAIYVTDERAVSGKHSLKIVDSKEVKPSWQPHFYYQPGFESGIVEQSFYIWLEPGNELFTEWRDNTQYPASVGPSIQFDGNGNIKHKGKILATVPVKNWVYVSIKAQIGKNNPKTFSLTIKLPDSKILTFNNLPFLGDKCEQVHWVGFSSTAVENTTFYIDKLEIKTTQKPK